MIKVYKYGLRPPTTGLEQVLQQMKLANQYQRDLLAARNQDRDQLRTLEQSALIKELQAKFNAAGDTLDALAGQLKQQRAATRSRSETQELRDQVKQAREEKKQANADLKAAKKEVRTQKQDQRDVIHEGWLEKRKRLRAKFSKGEHLYPGTYLLIEASVDQANGTTPLWDKDVEPNDPKLPRWKGTGRVGVQIQHGILVESLLACRDRRVQLRREPDLFQEKTRDGRGGGKNRPQFGVLKLRVGSDKRDPIWAEWPIKMHRPIPNGSNIKYVTVSCRKVGPRVCWTAEFTLDIPDDYLEPCGTGTVAIDVGWRVLGDEIRAAAWYCQDGHHGEVRLDQELISAIRYADVLRGIRDRNMNEMCEKLLAELPEELPEWLRRRTVRKGNGVPSSAQARAYMRNWKSQDRWAWLAKTWEEGECPKTLEDWRHHDFHLWEWEASQRKKSRRRRQDLYRNFAAQMTRRYGCIVLEDFDLRKVAEKADPEEKAQNKKAMSNRQLVATSELREAFRNAAVSRGCRVDLEDPAYSTQECPHDDCRHVEEWDAAASVERKPNCTKCGRTWDQDYAAAKVLLRRWRERGGGAENTGGAREEEKPTITETKRERVGRLRAEKEQRMRSAREQQGTASESQAFSPGP